jgi:cytochrome c biogenesis protein CcmG, thiol:disulfide interchange protein DsbE
MRKAVLRTVAVLAVIVALVAAVLLSGSSGGGEGKPAPELPRQVLVPPRQTLASLRGKPAAVNFWASWCEPCRKESPDLQRLYRSLHGRAGLVGVDYSDAAGSAHDFIDQHGLEYPMLSDPDGKVGDRYGVTGLPATAIIDSRGRIVELLRGPQTAATVRNALSQAKNATS